MLATVGGARRERQWGHVSSRTDGDIVTTTQVVDAADAGLFVLPMERYGHVHLHVVNATQVEVEATPALDGTRRMATVRWQPTNDTLVSAGGSASPALADDGRSGRRLTSAQMLGLSNRMITMAADYAKERKQFGQPIGSFQAVKHLSGQRPGQAGVRPARHLPGRRLY